LILFALSSAVTVALVVVLLSSLLPARSRTLQSRMSEMGLDGLLDTDEVARRARKRSQLKDLFYYLGERVEERRGDWSRVQLRLVQAGYREPRALGIYLGLRITAPILLGLYGLFLGTLADESGVFALICGAVGFIAGWFLPGFIVGLRVSRRQHEIRKALPDTLDLMVICVEAGLGLNQALVRVAREMRHSSPITTEELTLANMTIRAGTPRDQALLDLSERTGMPEVRSLATMLIQTERFGTSIARSLRVHAESMRSKRKQTAEEAAAKTTIKMIFPLALCIFPAMFVVILGPVILSIIANFSEAGV